MSSAEHGPRKRGRRRRPRIAVVVVAGVLGLGAVAGCGGGSSDSGASASTTASLKIGGIFDLSGPFASLGNDQKPAYELELKKGNAAGPVHLESVGEEDARSDVDTAVQAARKLVAAGAQVIIGPTSNAACKAVSQVTERSGVTTYCFTGGPLDVAPHLFTGEYAPAPGLAAAPLQFFKDKGWTRVACLRTADDSGASYADSLQQLAPKYGVKVVGSETFQPGAADVTPQLTKLRGANPQVLYSCSSGTNLVTVARGVVQLGWNVPVFAGLGSVQPQVVGAVKSYVPKAGLFSDGSWVFASADVPDSFAGHQLVRQFVQGFSKVAGHPPSTTAGSVADALSIVSKAAKQAQGAGQKLDGTAIAKQIERMHDVPGIIDTYTFGPDRHRGASTPPIILQWTSRGTVKVAAHVGS